MTPLEIRYILSLIRVRNDQLKAVIYGEDSDEDAVADAQSELDYAQSIARALMDTYG